MRCCSLLIAFNSDPSHPLLASPLLQDMSKSSKSPVRPTTSSYNIVLHALANSGDMAAPEQAQLLLDEMKSKGASASNSLRPDTVTYTTAISVMCRLGGHIVLEMVDKLLKEAIHTPGVTVDAMFFSNVLSSLAFCRGPGAADYAEEIVQKKMPSLKIEPDILVWNGLLNVYAKNGSGVEAEAVLERMEKGPVPPNLQSYTVVLDAYAKSDSHSSIARAETLIQRLQESSDLQPDAKAYTCLIQKYARSSLPLKAKRAQAVLLNAIEKGVRPTTITYNAVLNACAYTNSTDLKEKEEAFTVACLVFDDVRKSSKPNHVTYGTFLDVIIKLMPKSDARNDIAELVFKRCCKDGQVSQLVLRKLKAAVPLSLYRQMLGGDAEDQLPRKWTANVRERRGGPAGGIKRKATLAR